MGVGERERSILKKAVVALLVAVGGTLGVSAQSFQDAFRDGMAAFDQKRWAEAARQFQIAARIKTDSGENVRLYGNRFENYLPQYFLGRALYEIGDFQGAAQAFDASEQGGAVRKTRYYPTLQDLLREARRRVVAGGTTTTTAPATTTIQAQPPPPNPSTTTSSPVVPSGDLLRSVEQAIQQADQVRLAFERARNLDEMRRIDAEISAVESKARTDFEAARRRLDTGRRGSANDLSAGLTLAQASAAGFQRAHELSDEARKRVLAALVGAVKLYFDGRYGAARVELSKLTYSDGFPAAQVRLFRAAAAYSLYVMDGERDQKLRQEAETNVRECRRLAASGFKPDPRAFSPRFLRFFASTS